MNNWLPEKEYERLLNTAQTDVDFVNVNKALDESYNGDRCNSRFQNPIYKTQRDLESMSEVNRELGKIQWTGRTPFLYNLKSTVEQLYAQTNKPMAVIAISDGEDSCEGVSYERISKKIDSMADVFMVDMMPERQGSYDMSEQKRNNARVAELTGGQYIDASKPNALNSLVNAL